MQITKKTSTLTQWMGSILLDGVRLAASFEPSKVMAAIKQKLTPYEADKIKPFLQWAQDSGRKFLKDLPEAWYEWQATLPEHPGLKENERKELLSNKETLIIVNNAKQNSKNESKNMSTETVAILTEIFASDTPGERATVDGPQPLPNIAMNIKLATAPQTEAPKSERKPKTKNMKKQPAEGAEAPATNVAAAAPKTATEAAPNETAKRGAKLKMTDEQVKAFIAEQKQNKPAIKWNEILLNLRQSGQSCSQERLKNLC